MDREANTNNANFGRQQLFVKKTQNNFVFKIQNDQKNWFAHIWSVSRHAQKQNATHGH